MIIYCSITAQSIFVKVALICFYINDVFENVLYDMLKHLRYDKFFRKGVIWSLHLFCGLRRRLGVVDSSESFTKVVISTLQVDWDTVVKPVELYGVMTDGGSTND